MNMATFCTGIFTKYFHNLNLKKKKILVLIVFKTEHLRLTSKLEYWRTLRSLRKKENIKSSSLWHIKWIKSHINHVSYVLLPFMCGVQKWGSTHVSEDESFPGSFFFNASIFVFPGGVCILLHLLSILRTFRYQSDFRKYSSLYSIYSDFSMASETRLCYHNKNYFT